MRILSVAATLALLMTGSAFAAEGHFDNRPNSPVVGVEVVTPLEGPIYTETRSVYMGPSFLREITVKDALKAEDDTKVTLKGTIAKQVSKNHYVFKDHTGEVLVKIKQKYMPHQRFDYKTPVRIFGEVERSERPLKIEVDVSEPVEILPATR